MCSRAFALLAVLAALTMLVAPVPLLCQQVEIQPRAKPQQKAPEEEENPTPDIRSDATLALIPVAVTDEYNRPITGLEAENFRVFEDKVEQKISTFAMENEPIAICLIFDASSSMGVALRQARAAAMLFFRTSDPGDEFCMVEFNSSPRLTVPLTDRPESINMSLMMSKAKGSTALIDGVMMGLQEVRKSKLTRRAVVLVSDGGDNNSRYTFTELRNMLRESDALIFSIAVAGSDYDAGFMKSIAEETGGRMFVAARVSVGEVAEKIIIELRNRYILGYVPSNTARDGKYRRVEVQIKPPRGLPKLKAQWRRGYYARTN